MSRVERFEDLRIWQDARELVKNIYTDFREIKDFGFKGQIQDAGVSVMNNIAEGFERKSDKEFSRFLDISKGSCGEVRSMYYTAEDLKYITKIIAEKRRTQAQSLSGGIAGMTNHLRKKH